MPSIINLIYIKKCNLNKNVKTYISLCCKHKLHCKDNKTKTFCGDFFFNKISFFAHFVACNINHIFFFFSKILKKNMNISMCVDVTTKNQQSVMSAWMTSAVAFMCACFFCFVLLPLVSPALLCTQVLVVYGMYVYPDGICVLAHIEVLFLWACVKITNKKNRFNSRNLSCLMCNIDYRKAALKNLTKNGTKDV